MISFAQNTENTENAENAENAGTTENAAGAASDTSPMVLPFLKALADANRLRIIGLLAHRPHAVEELATVLGLKAPTVSHHLRRLSKVGLVSATVDGHYHVYALDLATLQRHARALGEVDTVRALQPTPAGRDAFDTRVLKAFLHEDGRIRQFPMKRKKFEVLLRYALARFDDAGPWQEREVNARLKAVSKDTATLRRGFVDHGLMEREGGGRAYALTAAGRAALAGRPRS